MYSGEKLLVLDQLDVDVQCGDRHACLPLHVHGISGHWSSLLGHQWLCQFLLNWSCVHAIQDDSQLQLKQILENQQAVFCEELSELKRFNAQIFVDPTIALIFCHAWSVPYSMRVSRRTGSPSAGQSVGACAVFIMGCTYCSSSESRQDIHSHLWRIKLTVNHSSKLDHYPLPCVEDLFSTLSGGRTFSKLDMSQAYMYKQFTLSQESKSYMYLVTNTHRGLFCENRLYCLVSPLCLLFFMESWRALLKGIPGVLFYLDDILIAGETDKYHLKSLDEMLNWLETAVPRLNKQMCYFLCNSVVYLDHHAYWCKVAWVLRRFKLCVTLLPLLMSWNLNIFLDSWLFTLNSCLTCLLYSLPFADCYDTPLHSFGDNRKWMHSKLSRSYLSQH